GRSSTGGAGSAPSAPGRALSIRLSNDMSTSPWWGSWGWTSRSAAREQRASLGLWLVGSSGRLGRGLTDPRLGGRLHVHRDLCLLVAPHERHAPVERVDDRAAIAHDGVVDLAADRVLDVAHPDAVGGIRPVEHQAQLVAITQLVGQAKEQPDVLDV